MERKNNPTIFAREKRIVGLKKQLNLFIIFHCKYLRVLCFQKGKRELNISVAFGEKR